MNFSIELAKQTRINFMKLIDGLTIEQLNFIPEGYNNNIAWNFAHIVASQQVICYYKGNIPAHIDKERISKFAKGSHPEVFIPAEELNFYKENALPLLDHLQTDIENNRFSYDAFQTEFGVILGDINDAVMYAASHDNLHLGYALALKRAVVSEINSQKIS